MQSVSFLGWGWVVSGWRFVGKLGDGKAERKKTKERNTDNAKRVTAAGHVPSHNPSHLTPLTASAASSPLPSLILHVQNVLRKWPKAS